MSWVEALGHYADAGVAHVLVTVLDVQGSAPRDRGSKMVVTEDDTIGSVGGGRLEHEAVLHAQHMLTNERVAQGLDETPAETPDDVIASRQPVAADLMAEHRVQQKTFSLGPDLGQCCGGRVTLLFEQFDRVNRSVVLFGAGHVGQALMRILVELPLRLSWFDVREEYLQAAIAQLASGSPSELLARPATLLTVSQPGNPVQCVESAPENSVFIVMTHCHELDFELCEAVLTRSDHSRCGLIASRSKARRFRSRLKKMGFSDAELERLVAPVGISGIGGKQPMSVAVAIAAQLLQTVSDEQPPLLQETGQLLVST